MGQADANLRTGAIPYYANIWGYNRASLSDKAIVPDPNDTSGFYPTLGDLANFEPTIGTLSTINPIRVLQPHYGNIIEANLNLAITLTSGEPQRQLRIAIGTFSSRYTAQTSYTDLYINTSHQQISGQAAPYTIPAAGTFSLNKLNLKPAMYKRGSSNFLEDAFVLLLCFDKAPSTATGFSLTRCEIDCTMQMGLQ